MRVEGLGFRVYVLGYSIVLSHSKLSAVVLSTSTDTGPSLKFVIFASLVQY